MGKRKEFTLTEEIEEVVRELALRKQVYPKMMQGPKPKLTRTEANLYYLRLESVLKRLKAIQAEQSGKQGELFTTNQNQ